MNKKEGGFTLAEVMISLVIIGIATITIFSFITSMARQTANVKHQTFATQKAIQIMEELRSLVGRTDRIGILDTYDNGTNYSFFLTTEDTGALGNDPANPLSGNVRMGRGWRYLRQISILKEPADPFMRKVYVRVYLADENNPSQPKRLLAHSVSIIKTSVAGCLSTQVMDVYFICIENIPGWWAATATLKPMTDELISDLQTRNPGLEIRSHWITRLAYGRDLYYTPYINNETRADLLTDLNSVYYYPGLIQKRTSAGMNYDEYYYVPENIAGRINIDGTITNEFSYALADQFNNGVRYPDEERLYAQYGGEISLRMLFEKMNSSPSELQNILIVNLHGELLPIPPMRNYSDAAKDPGLNQNVRVVTHPEKLQFALSDSIPLRIYTYVMNPDGWAHDTTLNYATISFPNLTLLSANIVVEKCVGNSTTVYQWVTATEGVHYSFATVGGTTTITLFDSPLRHPVNGTQGLESTKRLYGLEYIPAPVHSAATPVKFERDLTTNGSVAKNTARWRVIVKPGVLSTGQYEVDTRIGNQTSSDLPNLSRTYFWINTSPPYTEQFQFMGDPRHCPYLDTKADHYYNWFFTNIPAGDFKGYEKTVNLFGQPGWCGDGTYKLNVDVPRYFQLYRRGLLFTNGIYTSITGFSNYYVGLGGEMGGDSANDLPNSIRVCGKPWSQGVAVTRVNEIINGPGDYNLCRIIARTDNSWYSRYWIGELYPDDQWNYWQTNGNLPTGSGNFYRASPTIFGFSFNPIKRTGTKGCSSFINGGTTTSHFRHDWPWLSNPAGVIQTDGNIMAQIFNYPLVTPLDASRPFQLNYNGNVPPEWNDSEYSSQRVTHTWEKNYYNYGATSDRASSGVKLTLGSSAAYMVIQGIDKQAGFGAAQISRVAIQGILHQFLVSGEPSVTIGRIVQLPLLSVSSPLSGEEFSNPSTINIQWSIFWKRWDGEKYTSAYPDGFSETEPVVYNIKYSPDNGLHWYFVQDNSSATPGVKSSGHYCSSVYSWDVSAFSEGTYLLRIEGYRQNLPLHYTYQLIRIYIWR